MSLIFQLAAELTREMKIDYEAHLEERIVAAETACHGFTVTRSGQREGVVTDALFRGPVTIAYKWASPELVEYWATTPRPTLAAFEAQWLKARSDDWALFEQGMKR